MSNEEKILALLEQVSSRMEGLESGQAALEGRMEGLESGQAALEGRMERINGDLKTNNLLIRNLESKQAAFEGRMGRIETALAEAQDGLTAIKLRLELDVEKRFDAVNEGIDAILAQLTPKSRVDELESDVIVLKTAVKMLTQEVAELKKAQ